MSTQHPTDTPSRTAQAKHVMRLVAITALVVVVIGLVADNREDTTIGYLVGDATAPLFVLGITTLAIGVVIGYLLATLRSRRSR